MKNRSLIIAVIVCTITRAALAGESAARSAPTACAAFATGVISAGDYPSIQQAIDRNPSKMIFVPPGDHVIDRAIQITGADGGLWGSGRIVQSNPEVAVVEVRNATRAQVRDVTLTRPAGKQNARQAGLFVVNSTNTVVANVQVIDNWTKGSAIRVEKCSKVVVRDCLVENYGCITVEDWTMPAPNSGVCSGFAYNCMDGTGMNFADVSGVLIQGNRIIESRLLPTPELKEKYQLGKFTKKNATKGGHIDQASWDTEYWHGWRQGAGIHVGSGMTSDFVQIIGNYFEHTQQGIDLHADHVLVSNNIVNDAAHGIKAMHGARNIMIIGNQFIKCDLFAIGLMQGAASHEAGKLPNKGPSSVGANIDGYSIIADNIISDFGFGMESWIWADDKTIKRAPIQLGGKTPLADTPPLRNVIVKGNVIYSPGQDKILVEGQPRVEPPRYRYAIWVVDGEPGKNLNGPQGGPGSFASTPRRVKFADNIIDPGTEGISNIDLSQVSN